MLKMFYRHKLCFQKWAHSYNVFLILIKTAK